MVWQLGRRSYPPIFTVVEDCLKNMKMFNFFLNVTNTDTTEINLDTYVISQVWVIVAWLRMLIFGWLHVPYSPRVTYEILACVCRALEAWSGLPQNKRVLMDVVVASFVANFLSLVGQVNLPNQSADFGIQWDSCGPRFSHSEHINWFILPNKLCPLFVFSKRK